MLLFTSLGSRSGGEAPPAPLAFAAIGNGTAAGDPSLTTTADVPAGHTVVVGIAAYPDHTAVSDGTANVYVQYTQADNAPVGTSLWYCLDPVDVPMGSTITATGGGATSAAIQAWAIDRTVATTGDVGRNSATGDVAFAEVFTATFPSVLFGVLAVNFSGDALVPPAGWTADFDGDLPAGGGEAIMGAVIVEGGGPGFFYFPTGNTFASWACLAVAFA